MSFIENLRIGTRLTGAFTAVLALTVGLGLFALVQLGRVNQTASDLHDNWLPSVRVLGALNTLIAEFRGADMQHIMSASEQDMDRAEKGLAAIAEEFARESATYEKLISDDVERKGWETFKTAWAAYLVEHTKVLKLSRANSDDEAKALIQGAASQRYEEANKTLDMLNELNIKGGDEAGRLGDTLYAGARSWVIGELLLAVAIGAAAALLITRSLTRPIDQALQLARTVAAGDLTSRLVVTRRDETGQLLQALMDMNASLVGIVGQVRNSSDSIATGSTQIASGNADLSQRTEEQASNLQQTAASMEQMTATVRHNADTARAATQLAASASAAAGRGGEVVGQVVTTMSEISASSKKIADIIGTIDGIAFQTNILALNAAVEAARAGEQGRGFAVVASEVRSLAGRAADAAREIKVLIGQSVDKVEAGTRLVGDAGTSMADIVGQVQRVADLIAEIGSATQEQTQGIGQVSDAVTQLDQVTQQNAALVEESAAAADSLRQQAARLAEVVGVFRLGAAA